MGNPFEIRNRYGLQVKAFLNIGIALYDESPEMEQVGECVVVRINFSVQYLTNALTYSDIKFELSLNGTDFYALNYTQLEWANTFATSSVPRFARPDRAAFIPTTLGQVKSISFFDFDDTLTTELNKSFRVLRNKDRRGYCKPHSYRGSKRKNTYHCACSCGRCLLSIR